MITLDLTPPLFAALRAGFEAGICEEGPIEQEMLAGLRMALEEAAAAGSRQSEVRVTLESSYELFILADCFEVGAEISPDVTVPQWEAILALMEQARPPA